MSSSNTIGRQVPFVKILHQPTPVYRMRYRAEKRTTFLLAENATANDPTSSSSMSSLISTNSTTNSTGSKSKLAVVRKKIGGLNPDVPDGTFPKIQIVNGSGPATLIVSCVNKCEPYHVHPHRLIGEKCKSGVAVINIGRGETTFELAGVSIEFTKKHDIEESINELKQKNVDPFNVGFEFIKDKNYQIDLTQLRLCFQVYLRDSLESNEIIRDQYHILKPVLSNIICNSSRKSTLQIMRTTNMCSPSNGGGNIVMFLKRLEKDQKILHVKFYDSSGWSSEVKINDNSIHYQSAIMFNAPPYKIKDNTVDIPVSVKVYVPFRDDKEKQEFIKQQNAEDRDDEDSNEICTETTSISSSASSASVSPGATTSLNTLDQTFDLYREIPDGKYESPRMDFIYKPPDINFSKRKLDTVLFYEFQDIAEREATDEVSKQSRKGLAKRQRDLITKENIEKNANPNISELLNDTISYQTDPIFINFVIKHSNDLTNYSKSSDEIDYFNQVDPINLITENEIQVAIENRVNLEHKMNDLSANKDTMDTIFDDSLSAGANSKADEFEIESIMNLISSNDSFFKSEFLNKFNKF